LNVPRSGGEGENGVLKKRRTFRRAKVCKFCLDKVIQLDFKDVKRLRGFVSDRGKIIPRRISGNCAYHQRALTVAIKRARSIALLAFAAETS
jgi:small subunit ribosomal protein S18